MREVGPRDTNFVSLKFRSDEPAQHLGLEAFDIDLHEAQAVEL
ncbi:MAG: hypothetical protein AAGE52_34750 [Myxococcota bacterium]